MHHVHRVIAHHRPDFDRPPAVLPTSAGAATLALALVLSDLFGGGWRAEGTTIAPLTFEQLVFDADLVAVVRCTVAGGITARYQVVETLKGEPAAGATVTIRVPPNQYGPIFPTAYVGQHWLVTAWRRPRDPPGRVTSASFAGAPIPEPTLASFDHALPLFQGRQLVAPDGSGSWSLVGPPTMGGPPSFAAMRERIRLIADPSCGAARVVAAVLAKHRDRLLPDDECDPASMTAFTAWLRGVDAEALLDAERGRMLGDTVLAMIASATDGVASHRTLLGELPTIGDPVVARALVRFAGRLASDSRAEFQDLLQRMHDAPGCAMAVANEMAALAMPPLHPAARPAPVDPRDDPRAWRAWQEQVVALIASEVANPIPEPNLVRVLVSEGKTPEEAARLAPPRWVMSVTWVRNLDPDLRAQVGEVIWRHRPTLSNPRFQAMLLADLAVCPTPGIQREVVALLAQHYALLQQDEPRSFEERDIAQTAMECLLGLIDGNPEQAAQFFVRLERLPRDSMGMAWLEGTRRLAAQASPSIALRLLEALAPDIRATAATVLAARSDLTDSAADRVTQVLTEIVAEGGQNPAADEAALALAQRGIVAALPRLVDGLRPIERSGTIGSLRQEVLQLRALVLLSNLAGDDPPAGWLPDAPPTPGSPGVDPRQAVWKTWLDAHLATVTADRLRRAARPDLR